MAVLASTPCCYRYIQMLNRLPHCFIIHLRPRPLCDPILPVRDRRPWSGEPQTRLFSSHGSYHRCLRVSLSPSLNKDTLLIQLVQPSENDRKHDSSSAILLLPSPRLGGCIASFNGNGQVVQLLFPLRRVAVGLDE
jgi:hypothetical protein